MKFVPAAPAAEGRREPARVHMVGVRPPAGFALALPLLAVALGLAPVRGAADTPPAPHRLAEPDPELARRLAAVRAEHPVPALWGAIVEGDRLVAVAAVGVRRHGEPAPATVNDRVHLGSNTKAMTATLIALLVEERKLAWDSTVGQLRPDLKGQIHDDYLNVTIRQLLAHEGAVVPNLIWWAVPQERPVRDVRQSLIPALLKTAPKHAPGTKFAYSNGSYVIAGALAEAAGDAPWEDLTRARLFAPLGMARAGFGVPSKTRADQPWGHQLGADGPKPTLLDNPPLLGPAGTAHAPLPEWAKFVSLHLLGAQGKGRLLKPESFRALHTPAEGFRYAGGWVVGQDGVFGHDGSNGFWHTRARVRPRENVAFLIATNAGGPGAVEAVGAAEKALAEYQKERAGK